MKSNTLLLFCATILIDFVSSAVIMPPQDGRFFYSDFMLDPNSGLHEMNIFVSGTHMFMQLNT